MQPPQNPVRFIVAPELVAVQSQLKQALLVLARLKATKDDTLMSEADLRLLRWLADDIQTPACGSVLSSIGTMSSMKSMATATVIGSVPLLQSQLLWLSKLVLPMDRSLRELIGSFEISAERIVGHLYIFPNSK